MPPKTALEIAKEVQDALVGIRMNPDEVIKSAKPGSHVHVTLRGPAGEDELEGTRKAMEEAYPDLRFTVEDGGGAMSAKVVQEADGGGVHG